MFRAIKIILFILWPLINIAQRNDSLKWEVKVSVSAGPALTNFLYADNTHNSTQSGNRGIVSQSWETNSSFRNRINKQTYLLPELIFDWKLKHSKFNLGVFCNKINYTTPVITSNTSLTNNYYHYTPSPHIDSSKMVYYPDQPYVDNLIFEFVGIQMGLGYFFSKRKIDFDFDLNLRPYCATKAIVNRNYLPLANMSGFKESMDLNDGNFPRLKVIAYSLRVGVSYHAWKKLYLNSAISFTGSIDEFSSLRREYNADFGNYKYSITQIKQFAIHVGLAIRLSKKSGN